MTQPHAQAPRRARILVIDDEPLVLRSLRRVLLRHELACVSEATEAMALLDKGERFDVILCDLMMPGMSGVEFHQALTVAHPDEVGRVVFMTGGATVPAVHDFLEAVPNRTIDKPFELQTLQAEVDRMLILHSRQ